MWVVMGTGYVTLPSGMALFVHQDAWLVPFFFMGSTLIVATIVALFVRVFPQQTLVEGIRTAFGKWVGGFLGVWILLWYYLVLCAVVRELIFFLDLAVHPLTPSYVTGFLVMMGAGYAVRSGLEVVGRLSEFITPVVVTITVTLFLLAQQHAHPGHLQPFLADGFSPVLRASVLASVFAMELPVALVLVPAMREPRRLLQDIALTGMVLMLGGLFVEICVLLVLGPSIASSKYPILELVRSIQYGDFIEHLDSFYVMAVTSTVFLKISFIHHALTSETARLFDLAERRTIAWSGALAIWAGSIVLFKSDLALNEFILFVTVMYFFFTMLFLPLLAVSVHWTRQHLRRIRSAV